MKAYLLYLRKPRLRHSGSISMEMSPLNLDILIIYAHEDLLQPHAQALGFEEAGATKNLEHASLVDRTK